MKERVGGVAEVDPALLTDSHRLTGRQSKHSRTIGA